MHRSELLSIVATRILAISLPHPVRVAIDGVDAAGKTTLAGELAGCLRAFTARQVICASIDQFHNPRAVRYRQGPDSPLGYYADSFDLQALKQALLDPLGRPPAEPRQQGIPIQTARFDHYADRLLEPSGVLAALDAILLFDGLFLQRPELEGCWDFTIFVQVSFETVLARVVERDRAFLGGPESIRDRYAGRYIPAQRRYLAECRPVEKAGLVILNDDIDNPRMLSN